MMRKCHIYVHRGINKQNDNMKMISIIQERLLSSATIAGNEREKNSSAIFVKTYINFSEINNNNLILTFGKIKIF